MKHILFTPTFISYVLQPLHFLSLLVLRTHFVPDIVALENYPIEIERKRIKTPLKKKKRQPVPLTVSTQQNEQELLFVISKTRLQKSRESFLWQINFLSQNVSSYLTNPFSLPVWVVASATDIFGREHSVAVSLAATETIASVPHESALTIQYKEGDLFQVHDCSYFVTTPSYNLQTYYRGETSSLKKRFDQQSYSTYHFALVEQSEMLW